MISWTERDGPLTRLRELAREAEDLRQVMRATTRSESRAEGRDGTGLVRLVMGATGRVQAVDIDPGWYAGRGNAGLGKALVEAYQDAVTKVMTAAAERMEAAEDDQRHGRLDDEPAAEVAPATAGGWRPVTFDDVEAALRDLRRRAYDSELSRRTPPPAERTVQGPRGYVTISVRGGDVAEIAVTGPMGRGHARALATDALRAFEGMTARSGDRS